MKSKSSATTLPLAVACVAFGAAGGIPSLREAGTRFSPDGKPLAIAPGWGRMALLRAPSLAEADAQQAGK